MFLPMHNANDLMHVLHGVDENMANVGVGWVRSL